MIVRQIVAPPLTCGNVKVAQAWPMVLRPPWSYLAQAWPHL